MKSNLLGGEKDAGGAGGAENRPDARCQSRQLKPQPPFPREVEGRNRSARNDVYITIVHMCNALSH